MFQTDEDFINALGDALGDGADALSLLSDSVMIFHPSSLGHQKIRNEMESALEAAGVPEPENVASSSSSSSATATGTATVTAASAAATCNCKHALIDSKGFPVKHEILLAQLCSSTTWNLFQGILDNLHDQ